MSRRQWAVLVSLLCALVLAVVILLVVVVTTNAQRSEAEEHARISAICADHYDPKTQVDAFVECIAELKGDK